MGSLGFLAVLTGVTGLSLWGIKVQVETLAMQRIAKQFEEPYISGLVKQVAEQQSKAILEQQVRPEVTRFKNEINGKITEFDSYIAELKAKYEQDYAALSVEIEVLNKRNEIMKLGDLGTQAADRSALDELEKISSESKDASLNAAAKSEIARIKSFWSGITRLKGQEFSVVGPDGMLKKAEAFRTDELIRVMLLNPQWNVRALATKALGQRKEKGVPEALIECAKSDLSLEVVQHAVRSFESVTGYDSPDVLSSEIIEKWWVENGVEATAKLKELNSGMVEPPH